MTKSHGNEVSSAALSARKEKETTKKENMRRDKDTSSDSDYNRATERGAKQHRDKECKCQLAQAEADSNIKDHMIAEAEARNQAKMAKLAETQASYQVI